MFHKNERPSKWGLLYLVLAVSILFSVFIVPKVALAAVERTRGQIVTAEPPEK